MSQNMEETKKRMSLKSDLIPSQFPRPSTNRRGTTSLTRFGILLSLLVPLIFYFKTTYTLLPITSWIKLLVHKQDTILSPFAGTATLPLDHFNPSDIRTFENRYWMNDTYYQTGGPIFFYDAGEATANGDPISNPNIIFAPLELARKFHGIAIVWEHRFYGASMPFPVSNLTGIALSGPSAYKYLTNEQALQDTAYFATHFSPPGYSEAEAQMLRSNSTPWIWIGGSYPGVRAAMIRFRNPDVFFASWASSAPVQTQVNNSVYFNTIYQSMPFNCSTDVHAAITYADNILTTGTEDEVRLLKQAVNFTNMANPRNQTYTQPGQELSEWNMSQILSYPFQGSSVHFQSWGYERSLGEFCNQMERWNPQNFTGFSSLEDLSANSLDRIPTAESLTVANGPKKAFYAYLYAVIQKEKSDYMQFPRRLMKKADTASWNWQLCTQFAQFQVSSSPSPKNLISRFYNITNHLDWYCRDMFPYLPDESPRVEEILRYGGWSMKPSNTMFTNGEIDPWRALGIHSYKGINPHALDRPTTTDVPKCNEPPEGDEVFGLVYPGQTHVTDLRRRTVEEPGPVDQGLELFGRALEEWLPCFKKSD